MTLRPEAGRHVLLKEGCGITDDITGRDVHEGVIERVDGADIYVNVELSGKVECHRYEGELTVLPHPKVKKIPITAARRIAEDYGYHQVVIMARITGEVEGPEECVTTYGINKTHCGVAAMMGDKLKQIAQWPGVDATTQKIADLEARVKAQIAEMNDLKIEILEREEADNHAAWERSQPK